MSRTRASCINRIVGLVLFSNLFAGLACAQTQSPQQPPLEQAGKLPYGVDRANVPDAIAKVKSGDFFALHVDVIARADAVEAIPLLREQFARIQDPLLKDKIAAALVRLGDKDEIYWNYLVKEAKVALDNDAPSFVSYDAEGKTVGGPSPEFEAWLANRGESVDPGAFLENLTYFLPGKVLNLGWSRDPRAVPYLREGLNSANRMIQIMAALGLAEIGDDDSIPFIINACQKAPKEVALVIAESLVYFDDNSAQSAVDQFIPKETARIFREARSTGQKPKPFSPPLYDSPPKQ